MGYSKNGEYVIYLIRIKELPLSDRNNNISNGVPGGNSSIRDSLSQSKQNATSNTKDDEILKQERDSQGNTLSIEQQEYFKNSKVRDEEGNLQIMYHERAAEFTVFDNNKIGKTGVFEGTGFNFTPSEARAKSYGGKVMAVYLNVVNPLSNTKVTISIRELANIIKNADPLVDTIFFEGVEQSTGAVGVAIVLGSSKAHLYRLPSVVEEYKNGKAKKIMTSGCSWNINGNIVNEGERLL